jgi:hypothetical protein
MYRARIGELRRRRRDKPPLQPEKKVADAS